MKGKLIIFTALAACSACLSEQTQKEKLIQKEVALVVKSYYERRRSECLSAVYDKADKIADSTITAQAFLGIDTATLIQKPQKPAKPIFKIPLDSTPVHPLINRQ